MKFYSIEINKDIKRKIRTSTTIANKHYFVIFFKAEYLILYMYKPHEYQKLDTNKIKPHKE